MHLAFGFDLKKIDQEAVDRAVCSQTAPGRQPRLAYACSMWSSAATATGQRVSPAS